MTVLIPIALLLILNVALVIYAIWYYTPMHTRDYIVEVTGPDGTSASGILFYDDGYVVTCTYPFGGTLMKGSSVILTYIENDKKVEDSLQALRIPEDYELFPHRASL